MDFENARNILNLSKNYTEKELRKSYLVSSLKYHPDKNTSKEATLIFQNINDAYQYLSDPSNVVNDAANNVASHPTYETYADLMNHFTYMMADQYKNITHKDDFECLIFNFKNKCKNFSLKMVEKLSKENIIRLYEYVYLYGDILNISDEMLVTIRNIFKEKMKNDSIVILNPTIQNLLDNDLYKLNYEGEIIYIPLWVDESVHDLSNGILTIKCIPDLSDNISIDDNNNIHIKYYTEINNILGKNISINLGEKVFEIPSEELLIKKYQTYTLKKKGITTLHANLDISHNNDLIIHIYLI
jgi:hypothetical protein